MIKTAQNTTKAICKHVKIYIRINNPKGFQDDNKQIKIIEVIFQCRVVEIVNLLQHTLYMDDIGN